MPLITAPVHGGVLTQRLHIGAQPEFNVSPKFGFSDGRAELLFDFFYCEKGSFCKIKGKKS